MVQIGFHQNGPIVQDYKCLNLITEMLLSGNSKQAKNLELENTREGASNWVHTAIGRARCIEATDVQSGKYSTVTIQKWQTALGQHFIRRICGKIVFLQMAMKYQVFFQTSMYLLIRR